MTVMQSEISEQPAAIEHALHSNDAVMKALVAKLSDNGVRHAFLAARGTSDNAATYAKYLIEISCGIPVTLAAPSVFTLYGSTIDLKNSLVLGISQSGQALDVVQTLVSGKSTGAITACITNVAGSPLTEVSDFTLLCSAGEEKAVAATKTYTTSLALCALLAARWAGNTELLSALFATTPSWTGTSELASWSAFCSLN